MDWSVVFDDKCTPYDHQRQAAKALLAGKSVLLRAPTGSGKTEAICGPFLHSLATDGPLPRRMIYSLPMRVLATALRDRARKWTEASRVACQHGDEPESPLFERSLVFATIDQTIGSFITRPPSLPMKLGNIPAGAVASSFLAFDEVQLLDPRRALQAMIVLLAQQRRLGIPFVVATATLPDVLVRRLQEEFQCDIPIEVDEADIRARANRSVKVSLMDKCRDLPVGEILDAAANTDGNTGVICNTVDRARQAYETLVRQPHGREVLLLHSRFLPRRRRELEARVIELCGKASNDTYHQSGAIIVATQVIEAGLDISFDVLFTELAPVDSIIQRAGRVARGGGEGALHVFSPRDEQGELAHHPYQKELCEATEARLARVTLLDWPTEQELVNDVLGEYLTPMLQETNTDVIAKLMGEAQHELNQRKARAAVRATDSCRLSIHGDPASLGEEARGLQTIGVSTYGLRRRFREGELPRLWWLQVDWDEKDDRGRPRVVPTLVTDANEIRHDAHYVCDPANARHDQDRGLVFGESGQDFPLAAPKTRPKLPQNRRRETWVEHAVRTAKVMREHFVEPEGQLWHSVAEWWDADVEDFRRRLLAIAVLHDLGKLNQYWQEAIGNKGGDPLAHSDQQVAGKPPAHATVTSHVLMHIWRRSSDHLAIPLRLAAQHHHTVGAHETPPEGYELINGWRQHVAKALQQAALPTLDLSAVPDACRAKASCKPRMPNFAFPRTYVTYCLACRALRLSDWIATGGDEDAVLRYENWFRTG